MNREAMQKTRDRIAELPDERFNMAIWGWHCGTTACIAGHALMANNTEFPYIVSDTPVVARHVLGLTPEEAQYLFYGKFADVDDIADITKEQALAAIDAMLEDAL